MVLTAIHPDFSLNLITFFNKAIKFPKILINFANQVYPTINSITPATPAVAPALAILICRKVVNCARNFIPGAV